MGTQNRLVVMWGFVSFAFGCIADITGAPCENSGTCPNGQYCSTGRCVVGTAPSGSGGGSGGGSVGTLTCKVCTGSTDTSCGSGSTCKQRLCDGKWGCHPTGAGIDACLTVGAVKCPTASNFGLCVTSAQCPPGSECKRARCRQKCADPTECIVPDFVKKQLVLGSCVEDSEGDLRCYPACASAADTSCPQGTICFAFADNTYGYCDNYNVCPVCGANGSCPTGSTCDLRGCDGLAGCFPNNDSRCHTIGGTGLPKACNFAECKETSECGPRSACVDSAYSGAPRCMQKCTVAADCAANSNFRGSDNQTILPATCIPFTSGNSYCYPKCSGVTDTSCPTSTVCDGPWGSDSLFSCGF